MGEITAANIADVEYLIGRAGELFARHAELSKSDVIFQAAVRIAANAPPGASAQHVAKYSVSVANQIWHDTYGS